MIEEKLMRIQAALFVPKGQKNDFGGYKYRSCEDILKQVKPLAEKESCVLTMDTDIRVAGERFYIVASATLADTETHEKVTVEAFARESAQRKGMDDAQITGAATSYARKYALAGLFGIDNEKDPDATNKHGEGEDPKARARVLKFINDNENPEAVKKYFEDKYGALHQAKASDFKDFINEMEKKGRKI